MMKSLNFSMDTIHNSVSLGVHNYIFTLPFKIMYICLYIIILYNLILSWHNVYFAQNIALIRYKHRFTTLKMQTATFSFLRMRLSIIVQM
jgi:hypothetical protein